MLKTSAELSPISPEKNRSPYRVNCDRSRATGGSGLGLAISQAIVQAHYGSLNVHSELGKGSIFTIKLPFNVPPLNSVHSICLSR